MSGLSDLMGKAKAEMEKSEERKGPFGQVSLPGGEDQWNDLADLILEAEVRDDLRYAIQVEMGIQKAKAAAKEGPIEPPEMTRDSMNELAIRLCCPVGDLDATKALISNEMWDQKKLELVIRREQVRNRLGDTEELLYLAQMKLKERLVNGHIKETAELIMVGQFAERSLAVAHGKQQNGGTGAGSDSVTVNLGVQVNNGQQPLPGAGDLGVINLRLSQRVRNQIEHEPLKDPFDPQAQFLNRISMLTPKEIPELIVEATKVEEAKDANSNDSEGPGS
jgi:hypothetical protein